MAIRPILVAPDALLKQKSAPVEGPVTDAHRALMDDMLETMYAETPPSASDEIRMMLAKAKLASAEKETESLNRFVANVAVKDDRFTQLSLMTSLRIQKESEFFNQRQIISMLSCIKGPAHFIPGL